MADSSDYQPQPLLISFDRFAVELYREDKLSLGRAAELCQTPLAAFADFAAKPGVRPLRFNPEDLEEERRSRDRIKV